MRLQFKKGKQRELIKKFKINNKLTFPQLARLLKIKEGRLNTYYYETSLIPENIYNNLDKKGKYKKYIIGKKNEFWGKIKGGKTSKGRTKEIKIPSDSKRLAEFFGIMLGDGNSHRTCFYKSRINKRGTYMIRIVGDINSGKNYLLNYVKPLIEDLFNIAVKKGIYKGTNAMYLTCHSVQLIDFLEKKGFKPGNKIKNQLEIPNWIKNNKRYLISCLRGLYDTDGSVYKLTNQNSHQICFTNVNIRLMNDVRDSLLKLGINCSKISNKDLYITKKSELRKFLKLVGFINDKHIKKIKMWNLNSPVV